MITKLPPSIEGLHQQADYDAAFLGIVGQADNLFDTSAFDNFGGQVLPESYEVTKAAESLIPPEVAMQIKEDQIWSSSISVLEAIGFFDQDIHEDPEAIEVFVAKLPPAVSCIDNYSVAIEDQVHGRSLSTMNDLGTLALEMSRVEIIKTPIAKQALIELKTSVHEALTTHKDLSRELVARDFVERPIMHGRVMSDDLKHAISDITRSGLISAIKTARNDPRFFPQVRRAIWDHKKAINDDMIARGDTPNNLSVVATIFPEESAGRIGEDFWDNNGYVSSCRRGFIQSAFVDNGIFIAGSLSFDDSDLKRQISVLNGQEVYVPKDVLSDDMVRYPIIKNMTKDQAKAFVISIANASGHLSKEGRVNTVDLVEDYEAVLIKVLEDSYIDVSESFVQKYQNDVTVKLIESLHANAHYFNDEYAAALSKMRVSRSFDKDDAGMIHGLLVYSATEMIRALYFRSKQKIDANPSHAYAKYATPDAMMSHFNQMNGADFQVAIGGFVADGAKNKRAIQACGNGVDPSRVPAFSKPSEGSKSESSVLDKNDEKNKLKWMKCPHCRTDVLDDPCATVLACWGCKALVMFGVTVSKGDSKAKEAKEEARSYKMNEVKQSKETAASAESSSPADERSVTPISAGYVAIKDQFAVAA